MAHNVHYSPIDYLEHRVTYYKKLRTRLANTVNDKWILDKYGKEEAEKMIAKRIVELDSMVRQYKQAIEKLLAD